MATASALTGCGGETPARAIYGVAHDLEHGAYRGACERLFPGARLPAGARRALGLGTNDDQDWDPRDEESCRRALDDGPLADYELIDPRVRSVETRSLEGSGEVEEIATAQVAIDGHNPTTVRLVLVETRWRVVPEPLTASR